MIPSLGMAQGQHPMTVNELFNLVETGSTALRTKKSGVEVAAHSVEEAKSQRLPDINAQLSGAYNGNVLMTDRDLGNAKGISQPHFSNSFAIEARQTVYAGGALNAGIRLAEVQRRQAEAGVELTRTNERFVALGQYLELFKLDNGIKVYESNIALTEKLIADIKAKQAEGMALKNDVTRYELQMETLKLGLRKLQDSRDVHNHQLCNTLGLTNERIMPDQNIVDEPLKDDNQDSWQQRAATSSPLLRLSSLGTTEAKEQLNIERSNLRPTIAVFATDNFSGPFTYDLPPVDNNFNIWYVGVGVRYQLSALFKNNKSVRRARAAVQRSESEQAEISIKVNNSMQEACTLYRQSYIELRTRQKSVELANSNYQVMNDRYLNQLALVTDMVDASNMKLDAELQEVNARANIVYAYYKMKYIAGEI